MVSSSVTRRQQRKAKAILIAPQRVRQAANDKQELVENVKAITPVIESVETVLLDSGFVSGQAVRASGARE